MSCFKEASDQDVELVKQMSPEERSVLAENINDADPYNIFEQWQGRSTTSVSNLEKRKIICPFCHNGTGPDSTPVEVTRHGNVWLYHCFRCGEFRGDLVKIIATDTQLNLKVFEDFCRVLAIGANLIGYPLINDGESKSGKKSSKTSEPKLSEEDKELLKLIQEDIKAGQENIQRMSCNSQIGGQYYRNLSIETLAYFGCGYIENWIHPKRRQKGVKPPEIKRMGMPPGFERLIIPAGNHYNAVALNRHGSTEDLPKKYWKMHAGPMELFNGKALKYSNTIFIVEGEIDAMSIWQASNGKSNAVAVLGASNWKKTLTPHFPILKSRNVIVLFDSDEAGRTNAAKLCETLSQNGILAVNKTFCDFMQQHYPRFWERAGQGGIFDYPASFHYPNVDANDFLYFKSHGIVSFEQILREITEESVKELGEMRKKVLANKEKSKKQGENGNDEKNNAEQLEHLKTLRKSPERDKKIIDIIRDMCEWKVNSKGKRLYILPTYNNLKFIFDNDPNLNKLVGFDEFHGSDVFMKNAPWTRANSNIDKEWTDRDDAQLRLYLREHYAELQGKSLIEDMVIQTSQANTFNSVKNYFYKLPQWDGVPRAEELFIKFLKVKDTKFAREVTMNWLLAAVARIFHPGCRYQTALVLHGNQKIGKSYIIERLGGEWYLELTDNVDDPHASDAIKKGWIIEIKEMSAMRKAEINAVKAFIERSSETRREAYARRAKTTYRHCVFVITVNDSEFLRDATGNRRYLILHCNNEMFNYVEGLTNEYIRQVWAEVYEHYNELFDDDKAFDEKKLSLSTEAEKYAEEIASQYLNDDGMITEIKAHLNAKIPAQIIWQLLSKQERRKFHNEGGKITLRLEDLETRFKNTAGKHYNQLESSFEKACEAEEGYVIRFQDVTNEWFITFYGRELRQHICAAELFNECFHFEGRKKMYRINEILSTLEGWHLGARLARVDKAYPDQKKPFYRNSDNYPIEESIILGHAAANISTLTTDEDQTNSLKDIGHENVQLLTENARLKAHADQLVALLKEKGYSEPDLPKFQSKLKSDLAMFQNKLSEQFATQNATQNATQSTTQPATQSVTQPTTQTTTQPTTQPATQPVTQPTTQPTTQITTQNAT